MPLQWQRLFRQETVSLNQQPDSFPSSPLFLSKSRQNFISMDYSPRLLSWQYIHKPPIQSIKHSGVLSQPLLKRFIPDRIWVTIQHCEKVISYIWQTGVEGKDLHTINQRKQIVESHLLEPVVPFIYFLLSSTCLLSGSTCLSGFLRKRKQ